MNTLGKIKNWAGDFFKFFPVYFKKHSKLILFAGVFLVLLLGMWFFYTDAYRVVQDVYEVFVSTRTINKNAMDAAIEHIREQSSTEELPAGINPFVK